MPIPLEERRFLQDLESLIGEPIPQVPELHSYTFGYTVKNDRINGISLFSCRLTEIPDRISVLHALEKFMLRGHPINRLALDALTWAEIPRYMDC